MSPFASLFVLGVVVLLAGWCLVLAIHNAPVQEPQESAWDARDHGTTEGQPACHSTGPRGGHYVRAAGKWWVCASCGQTWLRVDEVAL